jgi:CBS domain-containing protein
MEAQQLMSAVPVWCSPEDDVQTLAAQMRDNNVGFIPVLSDPEERTLLGVVTDRDVCLKVVAMGYDPRFVKISEIMTREILFCNKRDTLARVFARMQAGQVRRLPVLDAHGRLVGIVSLDDVVRSRQISDERLVKGMRQIFETARRRVRRPVKLAASA